MNQQLSNIIQQIERNFSTIDPDRKNYILELTAKMKNNDSCRLVFVCTHNSRRSHLAQIWSWLGFQYYGLLNWESFSAGTEATAMHPHIVEVLKKAGFEIENENSPSPNPVYKVFSDKENFTFCFSKTILHESIPLSDFFLVPVCSDAEQNCPFLPGASLVLPLKYSDPKKFDGQPDVLDHYHSTSLLIATEIFFLLSVLKA